MKTIDQERVEKALRDAEEAQEAATADRARIGRTLRNSERVDEQAIPILQKAGLVHS